METLSTLQMSAKIGEPAPQLASPKPAKQSPMAALKGFLRSPPRADKSAEQKSPEPQVRMNGSCNCTCDDPLDTSGVNIAPDAGVCSIHVQFRRYDVQKQRRGKTSCAETFDVPANSGKISPQAVLTMAASPQPKQAASPKPAKAARSPKPVRRHDKEQCMSLLPAVWCKIECARRLPGLDALVFNCADEL